MVSTTFSAAAEATAINGDAQYFANRQMEVQERLQRLTEMVR